MSIFDPRAVRRRAAQLVVIALTLIALAVQSFGGPAKLGRDPVKDPWGEKGKPSATSKKRLGDALERAKLPKDSKPWLDLAEQYSKLDHELKDRKEPYEDSGAWFTHGMPHLLDILHLTVKNEDFIKEVWAEKGLKGDAAEQAYRDLILAVFGHDSQQVGLADPQAGNRKATRESHALDGGVATAKAYKEAHGDNPGGDVRAVTVGLAAAGHSKSAVDLGNKDRMKEVAKEIAKKLDITLDATQLEQVVTDAKPIAAMLGAIDALRERGGKGGATAPSGEGASYRLREGGGAALEVVNHKGEVVKTFEGVNHRTYVEYHTKVHEMRLEDGKIKISAEFGDSAISDAARKSQLEDIGKDVKRTEVPVEITYVNESGEYSKLTF